MYQVYMLSLEVHIAIPNTIFMVETIEHLKEMVTNLKFSGEIGISIKYNYNYKLYKSGFTHL